MTQRHLVAMGGGGFSMEPDNLALDRYVLGLARSERPKVAFVPTASGDAEGYIQNFYKSFETLPCEPSHLALFRRTLGDLRAFVLAQDVIYVGGGNTVNMLALWKLHGLDAIFKEAWEAGVVLAGLSAGALCWFEEGLTDSFGPLAPMKGLGLIAGSLTVHYDGEGDRRPTLIRCLEAGELGPGYAACDGAGLHFEGDRLARVVTSRPEARAYRVSWHEGAFCEEAIPAERLPAPTL